MLGSIREDDVPFDNGEEENTPNDDPRGAFMRVANHFFDPYFDQPLTIDGGRYGATALEWMKSGRPGRGSRTNNFSWFAAREAMWRALTLKEYASDVGTDFAFLDLEMPRNAVLSSWQAVRTAYWATTFRSLGDVVHLIQDMGQPQHTRNDIHAGVVCSGVNCALGHKSFFEAIVEGRVKGATTIVLRDKFFSSYGYQSEDVNIKADDSPPFATYDIVRLDKLDDYFSTGAGKGSLEGKGLANFSNRGFYTAGTMPGAVKDPSMWLPAPEVTQMTPIAIKGSELRNAADQQLQTSGSLKIYKGAVLDKLRLERSHVAVRSLAEGTFDQFLKSKGSSSYSLNHYVYRDQADALVPRAVAYSAGLLDYFFRGRLEVGLPEAGIFAARDQSASGCADGCGFKQISLKLTNMTPSESIGPGNAVVVVKFNRNRCFRRDLSGDPGGSQFSGNGCRELEEEIVVSEAVVLTSPIETGTAREFTFKFIARNIPLSATDVALQVVFRGNLGNEADAVVVTTRDIAEPNYVAVENSSDYRFNPTLKSFAPSGSPVPFSNVTVTFGSATKPAATVPLMPAPGHAQLAFLGDKASTPIAIDLTVPQMSIAHPIRMTLPAFEFYKAPATGSTYTSNWPVSQVRGVYRRFVYPVAWSNNFEVYLCSDAFNPAACSESTLPPLTSSNAVAWNVDFQ